jgi:ornithine carbamoyltransferase
MGNTLKLAAGHATRDLDLTLNELVSLLDMTADLKANPGRYESALQGRMLALLFEKPSLRTRLTFEVAAKQLGGDSILSVGPVADREPVKDVARNLGRWVDCVVARTFTQETVDELARYAGVPVINALSGRFHPCQALADVFTLKERFGGLAGIKLAFVGDGNNVAHSLMLTASRLGANVAVATPPGYEPDEEIAHTAGDLASRAGARLTISNDPAAALADADAVYTDVWASMGHESEKAERMKAFAPYQVNRRMMDMARASAIFMHCLPARRGEEVTDEVIESPQSAVFDQAENRLHTQKALLLMLL